jgi:ring-1,2-phenylacetyl-CoA epoxidase subunit PaaE
VPATVDQAFVCGPHALNDEAEAALREAGLAASASMSNVSACRLRRPTPRCTRRRKVTPPPRASPCVRDGLTREVAFQPSDESILAAASRAGMDVPYSCKSGVCATCRAKLLEGQVRMDRNFALEKADLEAGFILTCQAHPLTDTVVVSFDHR